MFLILTKIGRKLQPFFFEEFPIFFEIKIALNFRVGKCY